MNFLECNDLNIRRAAKIYAAKGLKITPLKKNTKEPHLKEWQRPENASKAVNCSYWDYYPFDNIGLLLDASQIVVLDIDDRDAFLQAMQAIGFDDGYNGKPPFYRSNTAGIRSGAINDNGHKKGKLIFKKPQGPMGDKLAYHSLKWIDDTGKSYTVFELRTGKPGSDLQDVLPPSIHPKTGKPYQWIGGDILPVPDDLLILWTEWTLFELDLKKADPNYRQDPIRIRRIKKYKAKNGELTATELIKMWNDCHSITDTLEQYGYVHAHGNRYLSPYSQSGSPGITINTQDNIAFNFGESDPLKTKHRINPFDVMLYYDFNNDLAAAVKFIKDELKPKCTTTGRGVLAATAGTIATS